jgi:hypothetical protein
VSTAVAVHFEGLTLHPVPHDTHDWLMFTAEVAAAFGVDPAQIRQAKTRMSAGGELVEGKHWVGGVDEVYPPTGTRWTKRGVIRLGFNLRSPQAKLFRDYAEDLVLRQADVSDIRRELDDLRRRIAALESPPRQARLFSLPPARPKPMPVNHGAIVARKAEQRTKAIAAIAEGHGGSIRQLALFLNVSWFTAHGIVAKLVKDGTVIAAQDIANHNAIALRVPAS